LNCRLGSAGGFSGKKRGNIVLFFTNYTTPGTTYSFKAKREISSISKPKVDFKSEDLNQNKFLYFKDGTKSDDNHL
jgi:prolyl oligopeptidase